MCTFSHPELGDWFPNAFESFLVGAWSAYVTKRVMADVAAEDKIERLRMVCGTGFGGHDNRLWLQLIWSVRIIARETEFTQVVALELGVPACLKSDRGKI